MSAAFVCSQRCLWIESQHDSAIVVFITLHSEVAYLPLAYQRRETDSYVSVISGIYVLCIEWIHAGKILTKYARYDMSYVSSPRFVCGLAIFFIGMAINIHSDHILRNLRRPGETGYKIPRGGMFTYVSGANFFGEIVEWAGFAIACWSLPSSAFFLFAAFNIGPRAIQHHRWYHTKFEDYPKSRKALIPFVL